MVLRLRLTPDGPPALAALAESVRAAKAGDPLAPVTVIVPTNTAGVLARRSLGRAGGIAAVQFLTLFRLAELLGGPALATVRRTPLSAAVAAAAVRSVLTTEPGRFAPVHEHPTTVAAIVAAGRELRQLPPVALRQLATRGSGLTPDLVRVHEAARRHTVSDWYDEADLLAAAADALGPESARRLGHVVVHLPIRLPLGGVRLLQHLALHTDVDVHLGWCDDPIADRVAAQLAARFEVPLPGPPAEPPRRRVETVSVSDADEEVRAALRIVIASAQRGIPLERIAVVWCANDPYQRIVGEQLDAAAVPWNGPSPVRVAERLAGRSLLALLALDRFGLRRSDLFALLGNAPVRDRRGALVPAAAWERISRSAGVGRGDDWSPRLLAHARAEQAAAADAERDGDEGRARRARRTAEQADRLREWVQWLRRELGEPDRPRAWREWSEWGHRLLTNVLGGAEVRARFPPSEQTGFERVEHALDELGELDAVAAPPTRRQFHDALATAFDAELLRSGRIGTGVLVGGLSSTIGLAADVVVVLGLAEGVFPRPPSSDPLLTESDRRVVEPLLPTAADSLADQRRALAAALASADRVVVGLPRGDLRHSCRRQESSWLRELVPQPVTGTTVVPSFASGVIGAEFPATPLDHRVRSLLTHVRSGRPVDDHPLVATDQAFGRGLRLLRARSAPGLTEYDGDLSGCGVPSPFAPDVVVAATRLESWVACPHRYFLQYVLRVPEPDDRDVQLRINALDRGNLLHATIDRFLRALLDGRLPVPAPADPWSPAHCALALSILDEECELARQRGLTGRDPLWERDRLLLVDELVKWLRADERERAALGLVPVASERSFGLPGADWPAAVVTTPSGRTLRFRGSIDRLDRVEGGGVLVTDHKTGSTRTYQGITEDPFAGGSRLQLAAYATAVAHAHGLESPVGIAARYAFTRNGERIGYVVTEEIWAEFGQILEVIGSSIEAGLFPMRPDPPGFQLWVTCPFCDPDGLGTGAVHRRWQLKQADPRLASYLELIGELPAGEPVEAS